MTDTGGYMRVVALPSTSERAFRYFDKLAEDIFRGAERCKVVLVTHLLPDRPPTIPKPKSIDAETRNMLEATYTIMDVTREELEDPRHARDLIDKVVGNERFALIDIGGYFAPSAIHLREEYKDQFLGVVE